MRYCCPKGTGMETSIHVRARLGANSCLSLMGSYTNCWSRDSDYRGLKKRITAIRQDKDSSIGNYVNVSPGPSGRAGPSTGHSHGLVDGGHEADDETNMKYENQKRLRVVDTRDDQIELKGLNRKAGASGSSRLEVNLAYLFFCTSFQISSQGDDLRLGVSRHAFCYANTHGP
jgi:hypothetical protein